MGEFLVAPRFPHAEGIGRPADFAGLLGDASDEVTRLVMRDNLRRRKSQARQRRDGGPATATTPGEDVAEQASDGPEDGTAAPDDGT